VGVDGYIPQKKKKNKSKMIGTNYKKHWKANPIILKKKKKKIKS
jgi:hypothetical protein